MAPAIQLLDFRHTAQNAISAFGPPCPGGSTRRDTAGRRPKVEQFESDRLVLCLDPAAMYLIEDLVSDKADTRILLVEAAFDDEYVRGHCRAHIRRQRPLDQQDR